MKKYIILIIVIIIIVSYISYKKNVEYMMSVKQFDIVVEETLDDIIDFEVFEEIIDEDIIATLTIPDILLENVNVYEGIEDNSLDKGIGHFKFTSIYYGNIGLAAHNYNQDGFFGGLKNIKIGSYIYYKTNFGTKKYQVKTKEIIEDNNFKYLEETQDNRITLLTCVYGQEDKRLCVQAIEV